MSGGVNGELLACGGHNMQRQLHDYIRQNDKRYVDPGFVMKLRWTPMFGQQLGLIKV
jgi:hypothetical protein